MKTTTFVAVAVAVFVLNFFVAPDSVEATAQWARKEGVTCQVCHQGFPRLNAVGQEYMENGYTFDEPGELEDKNYYETIINTLGFRINVDAVRYESKSEELTFGNTPWLQFFVAGQIAKDFSIFIETEVTTHSTHFSWYKFGYHMNKQVNFTVGNLSALDHSSMPDRLRIMPSVNNDFLRVKSSQGNGEASVNAASARPGIMYYGTFAKGKLVPYVGVSAAKQAAELTSSNTMNAWFGARYNLLESGSNFSLTYYRGTDVANGGTEDEVLNDFSFWIPAFNIRHGGFDVQASVRFGDEDNYTLATGDDAKNGDYVGYGFDAAYMYQDKWQPALNYDRVEAGDITTEKEWLTFGMSYFPRDNIRFTGYYRADLAADNDQFFCVIRAMF